MKRERKRRPWGPPPPRVGKPPEDATEKELKWWAILDNEAALHAFAMRALARWYKSKGLVWPPPAPEPT